MSRPLHFCLFLVVQVVVIQAAAVAGALIIQNRVAHSAMMERGRGQLSLVGQRVRGDLGDTISRFRETNQTLADQLVGTRVFSRGATAEAISSRLVVRMQAVLLRDPNVRSAAVATGGGGLFELRRGGSTGFTVRVLPEGGVGQVYRVTAGEDGAITLDTGRVVPVASPRGQEWFRRALDLPRPCTMVDEADGSVVVAQSVNADVKSGVVVMIRSRDDLVGGLVQDRAVTPGGYVGILPTPHSAKGWLADGSTRGSFSRYRGSELRAAMTYSSRVDGSPDFLRTTFDGRDAVVSTVPFHEGDLTGTIVSLAPAAELTEGAGSVVTSSWMALAAGLLSGCLVLPLMLRATRRVDAMHRRATVDALTGLTNRDELGRSGVRLIERSRRSGGAVAVAVLDLDGFKQINDTYGHHTGDEVLQAFAGRLKTSVRSGDVVARMGGDEFVVVMSGRSGWDPRETFLRLLRDCSRRPISTSTGSHFAVCTVGYADDDGVGALEDLIERADEALIAGKAHRKGAVYRAEPLKVSAVSADDVPEDVSRS